MHPPSPYHSKELMFIITMEPPPPLFFSPGSFNNSGVTPASLWLKRNLYSCCIRMLWSTANRSLRMVESNRYKKKFRDILKYRELILSWSMRFSLALFSGQRSVLCQNCCHGYQLINHLQVVLDVVSLSFFPQHNHWQSLCLFLNPHKWKCWLTWFKITVKPDAAP